MEGDPRNPRVSLLKKYDIPVDHLSYEYVEKCSNKKELERIVRILRSGEEGSYPDLLKAAEERLRLFAPESRVLRVETPILTKECLSQEEWSAVESDLLTWEKEIGIMDKSLDFEKSRIETVGNKNLPTVRKVVQAKPNKEKAKTLTESKQTRIKSGDYAAWDKFDVDKELLKMDVEEERKEEENKKKQRETKKLEKLKKVEIGDVDKENYSSMEQQVLANQAKDRGNECYKSGDLENALKYYEVSIRLYPTANAYNNRAMTYLKLKQYENAITDCNKVLQMEKKNIKALHRRATAYQNMPTDKENTNYDQLALQDLYEIVYLEPNNKVAQADLQKLKKKLNIEDSGRKFRMHISEDGEKKEDLNISVEKLPLTYYGPSTSTFQCEPYSMMHRALSGSSIPGQVLCKCNSNRPRQNPLCQKCGEAMCRPKVRVSKTKSETSAPPKKKTEELVSTECKASLETTKSEKVTDVVSKSNTGSDVIKENPKKEVESPEDKAEAASRNLSSEVNANKLSIKEVPKTQPDPKEETSLPEKDVSNEDKKNNNEIISEGNIESDIKAVTSQSKSPSKELLKEVETVCNNKNGAIITDNSSSQGDNHNSKKSKHKKKTSKEHRENKLTRKHLEPLKVEPVKVVHAAKYLHPTSVEPKVKTDIHSEPQRETNPSSNIQYKAFVPNRKCYSSESSRVTAPTAAAAVQSSTGKKTLKEEVNYSSIEGNKENISEFRCNSNIESGGKEGSTEEGKKEVIDSAYEFMKNWEELKKFDDSYAKRAEIIRKIRPNDLSKVIGIKLDSDMLSCLLECLLRHFVDSDPKRVIELLKQLPQVPRYGLVSMFLAEADKKKMKKLIEAAEAKGFELDEEIKKNLTIFS